MEPLLVTKVGPRLMATNYLEIYIPLDYFEKEMAINRGHMMEVFGILHARGFPNGKPGNVQLLNIPATIFIANYNTKQEVITVQDKSIKVLTMQYPKDSYVMNSSANRGKEIAEKFLNDVLAGRLPDNIHYGSLLDTWWRNMDIAGVDFKVPSKIYEMIFATAYRNKFNFKQRYGQIYGKSENSSGYNYATGSVRDVVESLSTFSGMVFEDMGRMITSGLNNDSDGLVEPDSPLEKIIRF